MSTADAREENGPAQPGRVPFRLWIGVTGHRLLDNIDLLAACVETTLARVQTWIPATQNTELVLGVISSLAEGADRLVAREVLTNHYSVLEVPMPLPKGEYVSDFTSTESKHAFESLLRRATTVVPAPRVQSREQGYAAAGQYVLERCDVLIALWDGKPARGPGGTATIVERARSSVPVIWINTENPHDVRVEGILPIALDEFLGIAEYNRQSIRPHVFANALESARHELARRNPNANVLSQRRYAEWFLPYFVRADLLALRFQRVFRRLLNVVLLLTVSAVTVIAYGAAFAPGDSAFAWAEFGLLVTAGIIVVAGRHYRWHDRWIAARFFAERLRAGYFLALAGVSRSPGHTRRRNEDSARRTSRSGASDKHLIAWTERAYNEVWAQRPTFDNEACDVGSLRHYLSRAWVDEQRRFHEQKSERFYDLHRRSERIVATLFVVATSAALIHAMELFGRGSVTSRLLVVAAIFLPAIAGSIGAIDLEREHRRHAERYATAAERLGDSSERLASVADLDDLRRLAQDVERQSLRESRAWSSVMQFHDFELK